MFKLLLKDFHLLKHSIFMIIGSFILFFLFRDITRPVLIYYPFILSFLIIMNLFSSDEKNKVYIFMCSLPVKRSTFVLEKYFLFHLLLLLSIPVSYFFLSFYPDSIYGIKYIITIFLFYSLMFSIIFPVNYRFGFHIADNNKNLVYASLFFLFLLILLFVILFFLDITPLISLIKQYFLSRYYIPSFSLSVFVIACFSYKLSIKIYKKRDFV